MNTYNLCCLIEELILTIKNIPCKLPQNIDVNCNTSVPQPLDVNCNVDIPQPLQVDCNTKIPQPLEITGTINCVSTDSCAEGMAKILSQSNSYTEVVFDTGEQYQKVTDLTVDGSVVSFSSQGKKIQTTLCKIEYVVL